MLSIKNVLFPTDFTESAERAFFVADPLVQNFDASLHLLHLISWHGSAPFSRLEYGLPESEQKRILAKLEAEARSRMRDTFEFVPDYYIQMISEAAASIKDGILEYVDRNDIDMIVMGTRSGHPVYRHIVGGTVEKVIRDGNVPVLAVGRSASADWNPEKILVAVDLSDHSAELLRTASALATEFKARLEIVHVISPAEMLPAAATSMDVMISVHDVDFKKPEKLLRTLIAEHVDEQVDVELHVLAGEPGYEIVRLAESLEVDMILLASHGHRGIKRLFLGSTARFVIHKGPCPVLTIKSGGKSLIKKEDENTREVMQEGA